MFFNAILNKISRFFFHKLWSKQIINPMNEVIFADAKTAGDALIADDAVHSASVWE